LSSLPDLIGQSFLVPLEKDARAKPGHDETTIGMGGYIGGRSLEKVASVVAGNHSLPVQLAAPRRKPKG